MVNKKVLVTGANGFIAKNLIIHLEEMPGIEVLKFFRKDDLKSLASKAISADFIFHLAGANRPKNELEFTSSNVTLTKELCEALSESNKNVPIYFSSSAQATEDNAYGLSKSKAETRIAQYSLATGAKSYIYRLPNVYGKWCKPNYNSVVATFCHNIARDLPIVINNPHTELSLMYVDDLVELCLNLLIEEPSMETKPNLEPLIHKTTLTQLSGKIYAYKNSRDSLITEKVGRGFERKLYATYLSYLPVEKFNYSLSCHQDTRGRFVEILKTKDSGQFSFFTAGPGITRGGHYHHSKTEKFLVVRGHAKFRFYNLSTHDYYEIVSHGNNPEMVETVPGWSHDITNVGKDELIVMLWANEIFDKENPDTFSMPLQEWNNNIDMDSL